MRKPIVKQVKSKVQQILHPIRRVSKRADGTLRIVRDSYHNHKQSWWDICKIVLERDDHRCRAVRVLPNGRKLRCTHSKLSEHRLEVHHVKPLSRGGKTITANLITLCERCHQQRHAHL